MLKYKHWKLWTSIYNSWRAMKQRCNNPNNKYYKDYGGRWIKYDRAWEKFQYFYKDMIKWHKKWLTIDRINNDWGYSKENCRWTTMKEQSRNTRSNIIYKGRCLKDWAYIIWVDAITLYKRLDRGWSIEKTLNK
jgi:hypothetical protein